MVQVGHVPIGHSQPTVVEQAADGLRCASTWWLQPDRKASKHWPNEEADGQLKLMQRPHLKHAMRLVPLCAAPSMVGFGRSYICPSFLPRPRCFS